MPPTSGRLHWRWSSWDPCAQHHHLPAQGKQQEASLAERSPPGSHRKAHCRGRTPHTSLPAPSVMMVLRRGVPNLAASSSASLSTTCRMRSRRCSRSDRSPILQGGRRHGRASSALEADKHTRPTRGRGSSAWHNNHGNNCWCRLRAARRRNEGTLWVGDAGAARGHAKPGLTLLAASPAHP